MRKKMVVGNWKMNLDKADAINLVEAVLSNISKNNLIEIVFAPSFMYLENIVKICANNSNVLVSSQDCSVNDQGAFTGEVSASMIASCNVDYVILGHSERRKNFHETNSLLKLKLERVLDNKLGVIFCCGESLLQREEGVHFNWIESQLRESLFKLSAESFSKVVIAYEPIWAIGTGVTASVNQAQEMHAFIRNLIKKEYGNDLANNMSILYGGSCNSKNAKDLFAQDDIDGGLIGGASLIAEDFVSIIDLF